MKKMSMTRVEILKAIEDLKKKYQDPEQIQSEKIQPEKIQLEVIQSKTVEIWSENLTKIYGMGQRAVKAVDEIDLKVESGIHGFLGPNGAGKTTTINMLIGGISISKGKAKIRGFRAGTIKSRKIIGFLPQDPVFYRNMTGKQYMMYMAELYGLGKHEALQKIQELFRTLELEEAQDRKVGKYSGGMKQRLGIAAALVHDPEILILDEPTANLDPIGRAKIIEKIKALSNKMSVFVSSHILSEIEQMCEKVTIINRGKIIVSDTIKNIKEMYSASENVFSLDTTANERVLLILKAEESVMKVWIDDTDNKIHVIPSNGKIFQESIPRIMAESNTMLKGFFQQETTLQDIFIDLMQREGGSYHE